MFKIKLLELPRFINIKTLPNNKNRRPQIICSLDSYSKLQNQYMINIDFDGNIFLNLKARYASICMLGLKDAEQFSENKIESGNAPITWIQLIAAVKVLRYFWTETEEAETDILDFINLGNLSKLPVKLQNQELEYLSKEDIVTLFRDYLQA